MDNPFKNLKKPGTPPEVGSPITPGVPNRFPGTAGNIKKGAEQETTNIPMYTVVLKISSIILFFAVICLATFLAFDLDPENKYLNILGYTQNTQMKHQESKKKNNQLTAERNSIQKERNTFQKKITDKEYSKHTESIAGIRKQQVTWFDTFADGGEFKMGLFDMAGHLGEYINSGAYLESEELKYDFNSRGNQIKIEGVRVDRKNVNFTFEASNLYFKVFNLTNEFIRFINASPELMGVSISSFVRQTNDLGWESMKLGVNAQRQPESAQDPNDDPVQYERFLKWVESEAQRKANLSNLNNTPGPNNNQATPNNRNNNAQNTRTNQSQNQNNNGGTTTPRSRPNLQLNR